MLRDEFDNATIPTIQALLLLAGHQQGSRNSISWLYSGLAIRLAQDMGLHRDSAKWNLDDRQSEIRRRVWWACFLVDRFTSAALGRVCIIIKNVLVILPIIRNAYGVSHFLYVYIFF